MTSQLHVFCDVTLCMRSLRIRCATADKVDKKGQRHVLLSFYTLYYEIVNYHKPHLFLNLSPVIQILITSSGSRGGSGVPRNMDQWRKSKI